MENAWWISIVVALIGLLGVLLSIWLQGRKDSVRIKDIDDKTMKVEPTKENTEKILSEIQEKFKNSDLRKITEYVTIQDAIQNQMKNEYVDYYQFIKKLERMVIQNNQLQKENQQFKLMLMKKEEKITELQEQLSYQRKSKDYGVEL